MPDERPLVLHVECYAGHRGEQTPRALVLGDRRIDVAEVLDAWLAPEYRYFKVRAADGGTYLVRHDERLGTWELTMFRAERPDSDDTLVRALRQGDERVFGELVDRWSRMMLRLALSRLESRAVAEEVVQDAWLTVLRSLDRYERRSTFRTWVLGIVVNLARSRARAERRQMSLPPAAEPSVDQDRFLPASHPRWPHHWAVGPAAWRTPEDELLGAETRKVILQAIDSLPAAQREVIVLRDIEGLPSAEVCNILALTDTHQRVLLHRARSRVRNALERYFAATETT